MKKVRKEWESTWSEEKRWIYEQLDEVRVGERMKELRIKMLEEKVWRKGGRML